MTQYTSFSTSLLHSYFFPYLLYVILTICSYSTTPLSAHPTKEIYAKTLSSLVQNSSGTLIDFSREIKTKASDRPVKQNISLEWPYLIVKQDISLKSKDAKDSLERKVYIDLHQMEISLVPEYNGIHLSGGDQCTLMFSSKTSMQEASRILSRLKEESKDAVCTHELPSEIARKFGYQFLAVSPREFAEAQFSTLLSPLYSFRNNSNTNLWCWLSKCPIDALKETKNLFQLFEEGGVKVPIFIYPLEVLDTSCFYLTEKWNGAFECCTDSKSSRHQSPLSSSPKSLSDFLSSCKHPFLIFSEQPQLHNPLEIIVSQRDKKSLTNWELNRTKKTSNENNLPFTLTIIPPYFEELPQGAGPSWALGRSSNSPYALQYAFNALSTQDLIDFIQLEYPNLYELLQKQSSFKPHQSIGKRFASLDESIHSSEKDYTSTPDQRRFLRIATLAHELGHPFGPKEELYVNTYPIFLSLLEQNGFQTSYVHVLDWYYLQNPPSHPLRLLFQIDRLTYRSGLKKEDVLSAYMHLNTLFGKTEKINPSHINLFKSHALYLSGKKASSPRYPLRLLFSNYFWETRDAQHRDGMSLAKVRLKYERSMLKNPHSSMFGRFSSWLDKKGYQKSSTCYLKASDLEQYRVEFQGQHLVKPSLSLPSKEVMFIISEDGTIYSGIKKDGTLEEQSFSHASFLGGAPVICAGKFEVDASGKILSINSLSGHYRTCKKEMRNAKEILERKGLEISSGIKMKSLE